MGVGTTPPSAAVSKGTALKCPTKTKFQKKQPVARLARVRE